MKKETQQSESRKKQAVLIHYSTLYFQKIYCTHFEVVSSSSEEAKVCIFYMP